MSSHPQIQLQRPNTQSYYDTRHRSQVQRKSFLSRHTPFFKHKCRSHGEIATPESDWNANSVKTATRPPSLLHRSTSMEAPDRVLRRSSRRSRCCITVAVSMAVVAVLVIVIAVAVVFTQRRHPRDLATTILVPLYMYPNPGVWDPLFEA